MPRYSFMRGLTKAIASSHVDRISSSSCCSIWSTCSGLSPRTEIRGILGSSDSSSEVLDRKRAWYLQVRWG